MNILGLNREFIKAFDTFSDAYIEKEINLVPTLNFTIISDLGKYFKEEYYVQIEGYGEYIVKEKKKSSGRYDVVCKPNLDDFQSKYYQNYTYTTNNLKSILQPLLDPIGWTIECEDTRVETLTGKDKTLLEIILHAMELFEYEFIWDIPNKKIICGPTVGEDKGSYLHQEVNLRELNITTHSYDLVTRLIPKGKDDLGIEGVNNGVSYLEPTDKYTNKIVYGTWRDGRYTIPENLKAAGQKLIDSIGKVYKSYEVDVIDLARLSNKYSYLEYDIGDTITLVDKENETNSKERVVAKKEYLREKLKDSVTLSNAPLSINQVQDKLNRNLENEISITRQYITVLEGEIKSKVSTESYSELETRVKTAEQKITDEAITSKVKSETQSYIDANKDQLKGADGNTPVIQDGYWYINGVSTGIKAEGTDGTQGIQGPEGIGGITPYFHTAYANSADGKVDFSVDDSSDKEYIGQYTSYARTGKGRNLILNSDRKFSAVGWREFLPTVDLAPVFEEHGLDEVYSLSLDLKSSDISKKNTIRVYMQNGSGARYYFVNSSVSVTTEYKRFKFEGLTPTLASSTEVRAVLAFYGTYDTGNFPTVRRIKLEKGNIATDWTPAPEDAMQDSDKPEDYSWTKIKGDKGEKGATPIKGIDYVDGKDGLPGAKGEDGKSSYTHIAYANNLTGTLGFSTNDGLNKTYIGIYVDNILEDSTDPSKYTWTLIKGNDGRDGLAGKDGVGVKTTTISYGLSTSETINPTTFTSSVPTLIKGQYLWTKTVWTYTDGTSETGYTKTYIAKDGNDGSNGIAGKDGVGIKTTTITYVGSTSGTVTPTSGWTTDIPSVAQGNYLWTKTTWNYTDNTSETGYSVARVGQDGARGIPGTPGTDGKTPYLHIAYATDTNGTNFSTTVSQNQTYIGTYTDFTEEDSTDYRKYSWTKMKGEPGIPGINGQDGAINSEIPPEDTTKLWFDSTTNLLKYFDGTEWVKTVNPELLARIEGLDMEITNNLASLDILTNKIEANVADVTTVQSMVESNSATIDLLSNQLTVEFEQIKTDLTDNSDKIEKLTAIISSGVTADGATYTEWATSADGGNRVYVGTDKMAMISGEVETMRISEGRIDATSLYITETLGLGNHVAEKYGSEFTIFNPAS